MSTTFEKVREKIKRNMPGQTQSAKPKCLEWSRETAMSIVSTCGKYRIAKMEDPANPGIFGYGLALAATSTSPPRHISGPFLLPKDARDAAEDHRNGIPLQADLA